MRWPLRRRRERGAIPHFLMHRTFHHELRHDGILVPVLDPPTCSCGDADCKRGT